jgi:hypothetical protein
MEEERTRENAIKRVIRALFAEGYSYTEVLETVNDLYYRGAWTFDADIEYALLIWKPIEERELNWVCTVRNEMRVQTRRVSEMFDTSTRDERGVVEQLRAWELDLADGPSVMPVRCPYSEDRADGCAARTYEGQCRLSAPCKA